MRFTVSQSSLSKALSVVSKGISTHTTITVLSGILIKASQGTLELQTTDLDTSIRHKIPANVEEEGQTVISGRVISNIVKNLSDSAITFDGGDGTITVTCDKSSFHLNTLNASEFPTFPQIAWERSVELPCSTLLKMVEMVYKATSRDTSRPTFAGIYLNVEENLIRLVATDSYRLAVCDTNIETSSLSEPFELIISGDVFHSALSLVNDSDTIIIGNTNNQVIFVSGNTTFVSRRIEGTFPNYKKFIPPTCVTTIKFKVQDFANALRRVNSIGIANSYIRLDVDSESSQITLSSADAALGEAKETLTVESEGKDNSFCMNYRYINDCVSVLDADTEMTLELQQGMAAGVFKSYSKINFLYFLMPVRM